MCRDTGRSRNKWLFKLWRVVVKTQGFKLTVIWFETKVFRIAKYTSSLNGWTLRFLWMRKQMDRCPSFSDLTTLAGCRSFRNSVNWNYFFKFISNCIGMFFFTPLMPLPAFHISWPYVPIPFVPVLSGSYWGWPFTSLRCLGAVYMHHSFSIALIWGLLAIDPMINEKWSSEQVAWAQTLEQQQYNNYLQRTFQN